jgi:hypothetical protein
VKDFDLVKAALEMSTDDIRLIKHRVEEEHPEIGCFGFIGDPEYYGSESNDFTEFAICLLWLGRCSHGLKYSANSYALKHVIETDAGHYVTNGSLIQAAAALNVDYIRAAKDSPNALFALRLPKIVDGKTWPLLHPSPIVAPRNPRMRASTASPERCLITPSLRTRILERDGFRCRRCGNGPTNARLVIDHVVPISAGGKSTEGNLQTLCEPCNQGKGARPPHPHEFIS